MIDAAAAVPQAPSAKRRGKGRKGGAAPKAAAKRTRGGKETASVQAADTPLRIPFGNMEAAQQLGARYRAGGWYAPPGTALDPFRERGWL